MRDTLREFVLLAFVCGAANHLCPDGSVKRVLSLLCTGILLCAIVKPIRAFDANVFTEREAEFQSVQAAILQNARTGETLLSRYAMEERCKRYIEQKAASLGFEAEAKITLQPNGDDTWIPYEAVIRTRAPDEAAAGLGGILREDLGIPDERQVWVTFE